MRVLEDNLIGAGGGGGGSSQNFTQTPDNLRSEDLFEGLLGLGVGPWKGPVGGMAGIRINGTPLEDGAGKSNFDGWIAHFSNGDPALWPQKPNLVMGAAASPVNINVTLGNTTGTGVPVVRSVPNTGAAFIDLRFVVSELYHQDKKGIYNNTAHIKIRMKPTGHIGWIDVLIDTTSTEPARPAGGGVSLINGVTRYVASSYYNSPTGARANAGIVSGQLTITGKTTSPAVKEVRIAVPNTGNYANVGWDIECTLTDKETFSGANNVEDRRNFLWESATAVFNDPNLGADPEWKGQVWLSLYGAASDRINNVPLVEGEYDTKIISVPPSSVFNPTTRAYTAAIWDGSYTKAYTNDPAWVINDALMDPIGGVSAVSLGSYLNKWDALDLSKYCSQLVPDGSGGQQPRFSLNCFFDQPQKADEFIQNLAGAVGAAAWDVGNGEWRCKIDRPENPVAIFTEQNIEGEFIYSHTDTDVRFNDITMSFRNAEFEYREDRVRVFDQPNIDSFGRRPTTVVALGCTNRQEALRRAMLRLRTSMNEFRIVSFTTNRQGRFIAPLNNILVADQSLGYAPPNLSTPLPDTDNRNDTTGRIIAIDSTRKIITLRDKLRLEPGASYSIVLTVPNQNYNPTPSAAPTNPDWDKPTLTVEYPLSSTTARGDVTTLTTTVPLDTSIPLFAPLALKAVGLPTLPKTYRVIDVTPIDGDDERVSISAIEVDTGKYAAADNVSFQAINAQLPSSTCPSPTAPSTGDVLTVMTFVSDYSFNRVLAIDWVRPASTFISGYIVRYTFNDGPVITLPKTQQTRVEIPNPQFGDYAVSIVAVDRRGRESVPLTAALTVDEDALFGAVGYLTNEAQIVPADSAGTITSYSGADGAFKVFIGATDVTAGCTFQVLANTSGLTGPYGGSPLDSTTGNYNVTGATSFTGGNAKLSMRATHTASGLFVDRDFSITKISGGASGSSAKVISLSTTHFTFLYTGGVPAAQTATLTASRVNPGSDTTLWTIYKADGTTVIVANQTAVQLGSAGYCSPITNDQIQITQSQFDSIISANSTTGIVVRAAYSATPTTYDQITMIKISNGTNGSPGANAKLLYLTSDRQLINYDASNQLNPATQTTTFSISAQNLSSSNFTISMTDSAGNSINANLYLNVTAANGAFSASGNNVLWSSTGPQFTMTAAQFHAARGANNGVIVTVAHIADGVSDKLTVLKTTAGLPGATISLAADDGTFDFIDGIPFDNLQVITVTATKQNSSETLTWSTVPAVTLGTTANPDQRTLSLANFGGNQSVAITATGSVTGASDTINLRRDDQTTPNDSIIPDSNWVATAIGGGLTPSSPSGGRGNPGTQRTPWRHNGNWAAAIP